MFGLTGGYPMTALSAVTLAIGELTVADDGLVDDARRPLLSYVYMLVPAAVFDGRGRGLGGDVPVEHCGRRRSWRSRSGLRR